VARLARRRNLEIRLEPNAVRVVSRRIEERGNSVATSFLRVVGLDNWDIDAVSIVAADVDGVNDCRERGIMAGNQIDITSNGTFINDICLHGQQTFKVQQNHAIECGVIMSVNGLENIQGPWAGTQPIDDEDCGGFTDQVYSMDTMFACALEENDIPSVAVSEYEQARTILYDYADANGLPTIDDEFGVIPDWIERVENLNVNQFNSLEPYTPDVTYDPSRMYEMGTLYRVTCNGNQSIDLKGIIRDIAIVTDCAVDFTKRTTLGSGQGNNEPSGDRQCDSDCLDPEEPTVEEGDQTYVAGDGNTYGVEPGADVVLDNVVLLSTADRQNAVTFSEGAQVGRRDGCRAGGGVRMYLAGSLHYPADPSWYGVQVFSTYTRNNGSGGIKFAAKADATWGVNIEAAGDVDFAAQGRAGACSFSGDTSDAVFGFRDFQIGLVR
jgi:hypothetical protein